jgi:hypothetical protein
MIKNKVYILLFNLFIALIFCLSYITYLFIILDNHEDSNDNIDNSLGEKSNDNIHTNLGEKPNDNVDTSLGKKYIESKKFDYNHDYSSNSSSNYSYENINDSNSENTKYIDLNQKAFDQNQQIDISNENRIIELFNNENGSLFMLENIIINKDMINKFKEISMEQNNVEGDKNIYNLKLDTETINAFLIKIK